MTAVQTSVNEELGLPTDLLIIDADTHLTDNVAAFVERMRGVLDEASA